MENKFTQGSIFKTLIGFAVPIFLAMLLQALYGMADLLIVGRFGDATGVSAVSTGSQIMHTITCIVMGLTMGTTVLLGQRMGEGDYESAARTVGSALWLFVFVGVIISALTVAFAKNMAHIMHAPQESFAKTVQYVTICGCGSIFIVLYNAVSGVFRGMGNSKLPLALVGVACVCNIIGDFVLVGILKMDTAGAAVATVSSQAISVIAAFIIVIKRGLPFPFEKRHIRLFKKEILLTLRFGMPIAAQDGLTSLSFLIILSILNGFGLVASAGVGVAEKICAVIFLVPSAVMSAIAAFAAQNIGAGRDDRAKKGMYYGMMIAFSAGVVMFFVSFFHGTYLASLFTNEIEVMEACADYLRSYSIDCLIACFVFSMMGYFNGSGRTLFVALQGIASTFLVRIPVSYFMSRIEGVSLFQIGFATPLASVFGIVLCVSYYIYCEKSKKSC